MNVILRIQLVKQMKLKKYKSFESADKNQKELSKHFPNSNPLNNPEVVDHVLAWNTFFRRNLNRCATDYLGIKLFPYEDYLLYEMGKNNIIIDVASRYTAKTWIVGLFACCYCITRPYTKFVIVSNTLKQANIIINEKIKIELYSRSANLREEIEEISENKSNPFVRFKNNSTIIAVVAGESARGIRSTVLERDEFRLISKNTDDGILSPMQGVRPVPFIMLPDYEKLSEVHDAPVDIYTSSSWMDDGHWMWVLVDQVAKRMMNGENALFCAFDESVVLKHGFKTMKQLQGEKSKQDPLTWRIEYLNERVKENTYAFFGYDLFIKNQRIKKAFYPYDPIYNSFSGKRNPYNIEKQVGEVRIVSCDLAFIQNKINDNSVFSCMRLIPDSETYNKGDNNSVEIHRGYKRSLNYIEAFAGGDTYKQAVRIRELFEDFNADYIVLDINNAGLAVYEDLAKVMYDENRDIEYSPLTCMNRKDIADRIVINGANPVIFAVSASQKLNSDIAVSMRAALENKKIDLLVSRETAINEYLPRIKEYQSDDVQKQLFFEQPFIESQMLISEATSLNCEKKEQTGALVISEKGYNRKDRYTSVSYGNYFADLLEQDLLSEGSQSSISDFAKYCGQINGNTNSVDIVSKIFR